MGVPRGDEVGARTRGVPRGERRRGGGNRRGVFHGGLHRRAPRARRCQDLRGRRGLRAVGTEAPERQQSGGSGEDQRAQPHRHPDHGRAQPRGMRRVVHPSPQGVADSADVLPGWIGAPRTHQAPIRSSPRGGGERHGRGSRRGGESEGVPRGLRMGGVPGVEPERPGYLSHQRAQRQRGIHLVCCQGVVGWSTPFPGFSSDGDC
mmetsp:Transcript_34531/g.81800  ORF Transcript_34531/g.81800 Transcript_34531/m.81800 type:complete len:205 (+) Transcript_34531:586-1200(+)